MDLKKRGKEQRTVERNSSPLWVRNGARSPLLQDPTIKSPYKKHTGTCLPTGRGKLNFNEGDKTFKKRKKNKNFELKTVVVC
jgi:hypothetical protein